MSKKSLLKVLLALFVFSFLSSTILIPHATAARLKKLVAVMKFEDKAAKSQWTESDGDFDLGSGMADQLTDSLIQSGQFVVLERQDLSDVIVEQDMASSGRFQKSRSARTGKLTSAQIVIKGIISELETTAKGGNSGINIGGLRLGSKKQNVHIALLIRLIDSTTGEVLDSQRVEGSAKSGGLNFGVDLGLVGFGTDSYKKTPIGKAIQMAMDDAVEFIAERLREEPYKGRVIKVSGDVVYLSAGKKTGVSAGDVFSIESAGEELVDPETGELLGRDLEFIGKAEVFNVHEKYSKARARGVTGIKAGDIISEE